MTRRRRTCRDTLIAGAGLCEPDVVAALADGAPGAIGWLAGLGARLETRDLRLEGGHSARRIVHSGDDATGAEVHRALLAALLASGIEILDRTVALDLLRERPRPDGRGPARAARAPGRDGRGWHGARATPGRRLPTPSRPARSPVSRSRPLGRGPGGGLHRGGRAADARGDRRARPW